MNRQVVGMGEKCVFCGESEMVIIVGWDSVGTPVEEERPHFCPKPWDPQI